MSHRAAPRSSIPAPRASDGTPVLPAPAGPNISQVINAPGNLTSDDGAQTIIDVIPDMRFMLVSWIYSIQHELATNAYASMPHASPASLLAFTMLQMVALMYFNDSVVRPHMSNSAAAVFNNNVFASFFAELLTLPVPSFAAPEFAALQAYFDDLATNLCFVPSLATTTFLIDYGRHFPVATFLALHNIMASLPANTTPASLSATFYSFAVTAVTFDNGNTNINVTPAMYFGLARTAAATTAYSNWLNVRIARLVTALAIRPAFTAPTIGPIPVAITTFANNAAYNPYLYLTGLSNNNVNPLLQFARSLGQFVTTQLPNSRPLSLYTRPGTIEPTRFLSFKTAGHTWSTSAATLTDAAFAATAQQSTHFTFLTDISFALANPDVTTAPDGTNNMFTTEPRRAPATAVDSPFDTELRSGTAAADPVAYVTNIDDQYAVGQNLCTPPCIVFDPTSAATTHLDAVITSGKIIETNDFSSLSTLIPMPDIPVHTTNASFLSGLVPFTKIRTSIQDGTPFVIKSLPFYDHTSLPQGFVVGPPGPLTIPRPREGIVHALRTITSNISRMFPGASQLRGTRYVSQALNYFGFNLNNVPSASNLDDGRFMLWSSYRWSSQTGVQFMLPSLRPIFGTRARTHVSAHPSSRIP